MTEKPELQQQDAQSGFASAVVLGLAAYVVFPVLALVTAAMGLVLVLNDRIVPGMVFLAVIMQLWVVGGLWAHFRRRRLMEQAVERIQGKTTD